ITAIADATSSAYRRRARASTGWPPTRWLQRLRRDPLVRLRLGGPRRQRLAEASARPSAPSAAHAAVDLATRALCDRYAGGLPSPWPAAALAAARSRRADLTDRLDQAAVTTDFGLDQARRWWRAFGLAQWLATLLAISGALWLLGRVLLAALGFNALALPALALDRGHVPYPTAALLGGLLASTLLVALARPAIRLGARRARTRVIARLSSAITDIAERDVIAPVEAVLADYDTARAHLAKADGHGASRR
ncbi:MAG TPA: ABC transporter, partial [Micromonosporaceae bacterium]